MFCRECGAKLNSSAHHCGNCGAKVENTPETPPPSPAAAPVAVTVPAPVKPPKPPRGATVSRPRLTTAQISVIAGITVLIVVVGSFTFWRRTAESQAPTPAPVAAASDSVVKTQTDATAAYEDAERRALVAESERVQKLNAYQKRFGALPDGFGQELTEEQRTLLADRIKNERADRRSLLQDLLDRDQAIKSLKAQVRQLGSRLPDHVEVHDGDRHDRMAMDFLINKGVSEAKAYALVSTINLQDALVPGFRVWLYYENGQFGTWVTQGAAGVSPQEHGRQVWALAASERDNAVKERDQAVAAGRGLQANLEDTQNFAKLAEEARQRTADDLKGMTEAAERASAFNDTLRYVIDSKKQLVNRKVLDKNLKLFPPTADVTTLDVGKNLTLTIDASAYGLKKIKKATVVPGTVMLDVDYQVELGDGTIVKFTIRNPQAFKSLAKFFVIVLE